MPEETTKHMHVATEVTENLEEMTSEVRAQQVRAEIETSPPENVDPDFEPEPMPDYEDSEHVVAGIIEREGYLPTWLIIFIGFAVFLAATMWISGRYY